MSPKPQRSPSLLHALACGEVWRRAAPIGLAIGLFQAALNQGDHWLRHEVTSAVVITTVLSPLITLSVALLSAAFTHIRIQRLRADES